MTIYMKKLIAGAFLSLAAASLSAPVVRVGASGRSPTASPATGTPPTPGALSFSSARYAVTEEDGAAQIRLRRVGGTDGEVVGKVTLTDVSTSPADYRFRPGARDTSFNPGGAGGGGGGHVSEAVVQPDGKILIAGEFTFSYNGDASAPDFVMRLNADGTRDASFNPGGSGADNLVEAAVVQPDGKIIIAGHFTSYNGDASAPDGLTRLNADGTRDTSFNPGGSGVGGAVFVPAAAAQPDGKIIIVGFFTSYNGDASAPDFVMRLNADGTRDASFNPGGSGADAAGAPVWAVDLQPDGKIIIAGDFRTYNGDRSAPDRVMRLDGTLFVTWEPGDAAEKLIQLPITDDRLAEGDETLTLTLSAVSGGAALGPPSSATLAIGAPQNPIDDARNFVRQHYYDFLSREPDDPGLAFWTGQTADCGGANLEACRAHVSAAFFLSIEFQQTGYLVERIYKVAYGDAAGTSSLGGAHQLSVPAVRFSEFMADAPLVGAGVVVGEGDWPARLEANKAAYAQAFVRRQRFRGVYDAFVASPTQYVDRLNSNAGGVVTDSDERISLINEAAAGTDEARASVLRKIAEHPELNRREFNQAFVLMQYFGYLRRDPDAAPDSDHTGYDFWLRKLEGFGGDFIRAEMVRAFITSDEYRRRFAQ